ncbi:hypothetical protein FRC04_006872 [Tulasnella sp. 424]|nr:hypothetical protein FRC04_006872 [Tulasnella sp. 424]
MSSLTSSTDDALPVPYASANLEGHNTISPVLASRICTSVLEHVLYLNGQIPFPVQGLSSLKLDGKANAKAAKKRDELMAALDVLSSHLPSTFQSLSWALGTNPQLLQATSSSATTAVDVVLITGPSPTTVRSRCFVRLDDFSISRYGERPQASSSSASASSTEHPSIQGASPLEQAQACLPTSSEKAVEPTEVQEDQDEEEHDLEADASFTSFISDMSSALSSAVEEEHSEDEETEGEEEEEESDASSSVASEDEDEEDEEEDDSEEDYDEEEEEEEEEEGSVVVETDSAVTTSPAHNLAPNSSTKPPSHSPSEEEQNLRSSVRAVSLALASTFDFGRDDIPVTQMNVLLRAPRCFQHPSWLPKQALGRTLDGRVDDFFSGGCSGGKENRKGPPEEGVLVRCNSSLEGADELPEGQPSQTLGNELHSEDAGQHDMIWWQWSAGVIRGFGDI